MQLKYGSRVITAALVLFILTTAGCGSKDEKPAKSEKAGKTSADNPKAKDSASKPPASNPSVPKPPPFNASSVPVSITKNTSAAIVQGADLLMQCDFRSIRASSIFKSLDKEQSKPLQQKRFQAALGLGDDDIRSMVMSLDMSNLDLSGKGDPQQELQKLSATFAIGLVKPVTLDKITAGIRVLTEGAPPDSFSITKNNLGANRILLVSSTTGQVPAPILIACSKDGKTVFMAVNSTSLYKALTRASQNSIEKSSPAMSKIRKALLPGSQVEICFIAPQVLRDKITSQLNKLAESAADNPMANMMAGTIKPFQKIKSAGMSMRMGNQVQLQISADLGGAEEARGAAALIESTVLPQMQVQLVRMMQGQPAPDLSEILDIHTNGDTLSVGFTLTEDLLEKAANSAVAHVSAGDMPPHMTAGGANASLSDDPQEFAPGEKIVGKSLREVEHRMGPPIGRMKKGNLVILMYDDMDITSRNGRTVTSVDYK